MDNKILQWLEKTGYPFELFAESKLSKHGFRTSSSALYEDVETGKYREIDLIAFKIWEEKGVYLDITLHVECKKSEKPFVLLRNGSEDEAVLTISQYYTVNHHRHLVPFFLKSPHLDIEFPNIAKRGFKLIQAFTDGDEVVNRGINTLMKSFYDSLAKEKDLIDHYIKDNVHSLNLPVLLIDAPLFSANIENDLLTLDEIDFGIIDSLSHNSYPEAFPILVCPKKSIDVLLNLITDFGNLNIDYLVKNPILNVKNSNDISMKLFHKDNPDNGTTIKLS